MKRSYSEAAKRGESLSRSSRSAKRNLDPHSHPDLVLRILGHDLQQLVTDYLVGTRQMWRRRFFEECVLLLQGKTVCLECRKVYESVIPERRWAVGDGCAMIALNDGYMDGLCDWGSKYDCGMMGGLWVQLKINRPQKFQYNSTLCYCDPCVGNFIKQGDLTQLDQIHFKCSRCNLFRPFEMHGRSPDICEHCITQSERDHANSMAPFSDNMTATLI